MNKSGIVENFVFDDQRKERKRGEAVDGLRRLSVPTDGERGEAK